MKLILPGTGANECIPAFRCSCDVCNHARQIGGKELRQNSCAVIQSSSGRFSLIDMPPQFQAQLSRWGVNDRDIDLIFITHRHEDHILGGRTLFQWKPGKGFHVESPVDVYLPRSVWLSMSKKFLSDKEAETLPINSGSYNLNFISDEQIITQRDMTITAMETGHLRIKSAGSSEANLGFLFEDNDGKTLAYIMDSPKNLPSQTLEILKKRNIDCLVSDCTFKETGLKSGHSDLAACLALRDAVNPERMIISHMGHRNMNHRDLVEYLKDSGIEPAYDGMQINI